MKKERKSRRLHKSLVIPIVSGASVIFVGFLLTGIFLGTGNDYQLGSAILRDIIILLISTMGTLLGLYVTAFIFLNDSLKNRAAEDPTIKEPIDNIMARCRRSMLFFAFATVLSIVLDVIFNIFLAQASGDDPSKTGGTIDDLRLHISDDKWKFFILLTGASVFIIAWFIFASREIMDSDHLIRDEATRNLSKHFFALRKLFDESILQTSSTSSVGSDLEDLKEKAASMLRKDRLRGKYSFRRAYDALESDGALYVGEDVQNEDFVVMYGKWVRLVETMVSRICDNNIDKSIMVGDIAIHSMKAGFTWLYTRDEKNSSSAINRDAEKEAENQSFTKADIRLRNRFLDCLKYQLITDIRFRQLPFDNLEVEEAFKIVLKNFDRLDVGVLSGSDAQNQNNLLSEYVSEMVELIKVFFNFYDHLIGFRDALIHFDAYDRDKHGEKNESFGGIGKNKTLQKLFVKENKNLLLNCALLVKRVLIDRFTSFVKVDDMNLGNSTLIKGWFNYSEFSNSNFTHSNFRFARLENAIFKNCDLSACDFNLADASGTNFSHSNFSYGDLTGMDLSDADLSYAQMGSVILRDRRIDAYKSEGFLTSAMTTEHIGLFDALLASGESKPSPDGDTVVNPLIYKLRRDLELRRAWMQKEDTASYRGVAPFFNHMNEDYLRHEGTLHLGATTITGISLPPQDEEEATLRQKQLAELGMPIQRSLLDEDYGVMFPYYLIGKDERNGAKGELAPFFEYRRFSKITSRMHDAIPWARLYELGLFPIIPDDRFDGRPAFRGEMDTSKLDRKNKESRERVYGKIMFDEAILDESTADHAVFEDVDFSYVKMRGASFHEADLSGSDMYHTCAEGAMFHRANLNNLDAYRADFAGANFSEAKLRAAVFADCQLQGANFKSSLLLGSVIVYSMRRLKKPDSPIYLSRFLAPSGNERLLPVEEVLEEEIVYDEKGLPTEEIRSIASLDEDCNVKDCEFDDAIANEIAVANANMMRSNFTGASLRDARFFNVLLRWCSFERSNLSGALFVGVSFYQSNFIGANAPRAFFSGCEMANANLTEANFISAYFERVVFHETSFVDAKFAGAKFVRCSFDRCTFHKALLTDCEFVDCVFIGYDFESVIGFDEMRIIRCAFQKTINETRDGVENPQQGSFFLSGPNGAKAYLDVDLGEDLDAENQAKRPDTFTLSTLLGSSYRPVGQ